MRDYLEGMGTGVLIGFVLSAFIFWGLAALFGAS